MFTRNKHFNLNMIMKKIYIKPFMKDHKLLRTNNLLVGASKLNDDEVYDDIVDDEEYDLIIAKNRSRREGVVKLRPHLEYSKFNNYKSR